MHKKTENGRSMIEMLGVLAIIGVLSVGGIAGYSKAMMQYRINKTIDQITQTVANVKNLYGRQKNYEGLASYNDAGRNLIKRAKLVPDEMWDNNELKNVFDGRYDLQDFWFSGEHGEFDKAFLLYLTDIPEEACIALVTKDWGDNSAGFLAMGFGEGPDNAIGYDCHFDKESWESDEGDAYACVFDKTSYPVSVSQAALGCICPNDLCTVVFTFQ